MRCRYFFALVSWFALTAMAGCGGHPFVLEEHTGHLEATHVVVDLFNRAGMAEIVHDAPSIDIGSAASSGALVAGWGDSELDSTSKTTFAWAIADRASLETVLLSTDYAELQFRCRPFQWDGSPGQQLEVAVNGHEIGDLVFDSGFRDYSLPLPEGTIGVGLNRVDLRFSWTAVPADHLPGNTDLRTLAAAFQWVRFGQTDTGTPAPSVLRDPVFGGHMLEIPSGTGLRYRLTVPENAVLDLGVTTVPPTAPGLRGRLWVARPGEPAEASVVVDPVATGGDRVRFKLEGRVGETIDLGLAAFGDDADGGALVIHTPRVLGSGKDADEVASLLLIVVDTLRADYLGTYGADVSTPNVDALAARGVRFDQARSHIPITGPSHASLFTSLLPMEHGVINNAQRLTTDFPTLAESLREAGRTTAGVISLGVIQRDFGFGRGFDHFGDGFPRDWLKDAVEVTDEALEVSKGLRGGPYFLWVHYSDPHEPYAPLDADYPKFDLRINGRPVGEFDARGRGFWFDVVIPAGESLLELVPYAREPERIFRIDNLDLHDESIDVEPLEGWEVINRRLGRTTLESAFPASIRLTNASKKQVETRLLISCKELLGKPGIRRAYAREVEIVDREIGRLLDGLKARGLMNNTVVIFASDHGEGLGNHNHVGHISQLYDSLLHVPLIFNWPGQLPEGVVIDASVSLIDVFPTVAELLGIDGPTLASGASLLPLMRGEDPSERAVIAATYRPESFSEKRAIVLDGFKYIHSWKDENENEELYDVINDPGELENLAEANPETLERLRKELARRLSEIAERSPVEAELSDEDRAHLRALGYVH